MIKAPCKGCWDRKLGCHGRCERYAEFRKKLEKANEQLIAENEIDRYIVQNSIKRSAKKQRSKGGKKWKDLDG